MGYPTITPLRRELGGHAPAEAAVEALAGAVTAEVRLLEDLLGIMRRQRTAVSTDDLQGIDDSVYATHRVLVTLGEARRRRRSLSQLVGGSEDFPLKELSDHLGDLMSDSLRFACEGLHAVALTLSQEVEMNRQVLREALAAGHEYVRAIYGGGPEPIPLYTSDPQRTERDGRGGGLLLNRKV